MTDAYLPPQAPPVVEAQPIPERDPYQGRDLVADGAAALEAARAQARAQAFRFVNGGEVFELLPTFDLRIQMALNRGNLARALELALVDGETGVDRLLATDEPMSEARFQAIIETWTEATQDASQGESGASSNS